MSFNADNKILSRLLYEFEHHVKNELYSICQFKLAARSNQVEGNTMTEDDTAILFDTQQIPSTEYKALEIEEAQGHFLMFNEMLKTVNEPLSEEIIKSYHKAMTEGIFEFKANGGKPGEYKIRENIAGTTTTTSPDKVKEELSELLKEYNAKENDIKIKDIAYFHSKYEHIHPFQDYNGRTGRMILFRESLKYLTPIVVNSKDRKEYIEAIKLAQESDDTKKLEDKLKEWQESFYKEIEKYI